MDRNVIIDGRTYGCFRTVKVFVVQNISINTTRGHVGKSSNLCFAGEWCRCLRLGFLETVAQIFLGFEL